MTTALDRRYGRTPERTRRGRVLAITAAVAVAATTIAWAIWGGALQPEAQYETQDIGYVVESDTTTTVRAQVSIEPGQTARCAIAARDESDAYVGWQMISLPAAEVRTRELTVSLRTTSRAAVGLIYGCWLT